MFEFDPTFAVGLGIPISIVDDNGRRRLASDQFAAVMRRSYDELVGVPWQAVAHVDDVKHGNKLMYQTLSSDAPVASRRRFIRGDGLVFEAVLHGRRLPHPRGRGYIIQTNMNLVTTLAETRGLDEATDGLPSDAPSLLEIVRNRAADLSTAAGSLDMRLLQHLLAMASAEAASELERRRTHGAIAEMRDRGSMH